MHYEYKVVPAPSKPQKGLARKSGVKGAEGKFALGLETTMNAYAADGWEYQRADILPSEERRGLRSSQTVYRTVLVFRRRIAGAEETTQPMAVSEAAPSPVPEPTYEETRDMERQARFSLVGPARRGDPMGAPPLSAPHISDDMPSDPDQSDGSR